MKKKQKVLGHLNGTMAIMYHMEPETLPESKQTAYSVKSGLHPEQNGTYKKPPYEIPARNLNQNGNPEYNI